MYERQEMRQEEDVLIDFGVKGNEDSSSSFDHNRNIR